VAPSVHRGPDSDGESEAVWHPGVVATDQEGAREALRVAHAAVEALRDGPDGAASDPVDLTIMQAPGGWLVRPTDGGALTYVPDPGWTWPAWREAAGLDAAVAGADDRPPHKRAEAGWWVMVEGCPWVDSAWLRVAGVDDADSFMRLRVSVGGVRRSVANHHITDARPCRP
jgi:hypothetical protein